MSAAPTYYDGAGEAFLIIFLPFLQKLIKICRKEVNELDEKEKKDFRRKEKSAPGWEIDPMEAMICGNSISMLSSGIAVPVINLPDREDEERKMRE